ncbi:MAG: hydroxymethylbilane synthase [Alphaproteobacteria bacterium]|jgi:hydroxymethylbilane synthase
MTRILKIGTRRSRLALAQTEMVRKAIAEVVPDISFEIIEYITTGDKFLGDLSKVGGKGVFVKEIEDAMLKGEIDLAMHSMKDMPNKLPEGLVVPAVLARNDIRDAVICAEGQTFEGLKEGSKIGTSSLRRASQLRRNFPHLHVVPVRGNVDTRIAKLKTGEIDAVVLAKAGLDRLGWDDKITLVFEPDMMLPAVGQGAVGIECKADDQELLDILAKVNCEETFTCIEAEREMSLLLGGNCQTPIAGFCEVTKGHNLRFIAHVTSPDGKTIVRARQKMPYDNPKALGKAIADDLLAQGAEAIISAIKDSV